MGVTTDGEEECPVRWCLSHPGGIGHLEKGIEERLGYVILGSRSASLNYGELPPASVLSSELWDKYSGVTYLLQGYKFVLGSGP